MLAHRLRRWLNIKITLAKHIVFAGDNVDYFHDMALILKYYQRYFPCTYRRTAW